MPSETVEIVLSDLSPYESGAMYFAVVAYPSPDDKNERERFYRAVIRWTIERRMTIDPKWAGSPQFMKPAYFSISQKQSDATLNRGMKQLIRRLTISHHMAVPHLRAIDTGKEQTVGEYKFAPTVENMALLAADALGMSPKSVPTIKSKNWAPSKPVLHAAAAFWVWHEILWDRLKRPKIDKTMAFLMMPELVEEVVEYSEIFRQQLLTVKKFTIRESETIHFTTRKAEIKIPDHLLKILKETLGF